MTVLLSCPVLQVVRVDLAPLSGGFCEFCPQILLPLVWVTQGAVFRLCACPLAAPAHPVARSEWDLGSGLYPEVRGCPREWVSQASSVATILCAVCAFQARTFRGGEGEEDGCCTWFIRSEAAYFLAEVRTRLCQERKERLQREGVTRSTMSRREKGSGARAQPVHTQVPGATLARALAKAGCKSLTSLWPEEGFRG